MTNQIQNQKQYDTILNLTFAYAKKVAKEFYFTWSKQPPQCPAFGGEVVHISRHGWDHLLRDRKRSKVELLGRLFVLERARYLLESAPNFQKHLQRADMDFWSFEAEIEGVRLKVIVRSIKGESKHFYSVIRKGSVEHEIQNT